MMGEKEARKMEREIQLLEAKIEEMVPSDDETKEDNIFEREMKLID